MTINVYVCKSSTLILLETHKMKKLTNAEMQALLSNVQVIDDESVLPKETQEVRSVLLRLGAFRALAWLESEGFSVTKTNA